MEVKKTVLGKLEKCYALAMLEYNGRKHFMAAAEKINKCLMFGLDGALEETVWEEPGGVMSMVQVPDSNGVFLATHRFYSPNDSKDAKIIIAEPLTRNNWRIRTLVELPFVHRFDILQSGGINYLIACTLKSGHKCKDDWSSPGKVYAAALPEDLRIYDKNHQLPLQVIAEGYTKNHGYYRGNEGLCDNAVISCDGGVYHYTAPGKDGEKWTIEKLIDTPASDAALIDMDMDGEKELFVLSPFHGDTVSIYKKCREKYKKIYEYPEKLEFLHAFLGGNINGIPTVVVGHRKGKRKLLAFRYHQTNGYQAETLDTGAGAANVLRYRYGEKEIIIAANRESDEIAMYELIEREDAKEKMQSRKK